MIRFVDLGDQITCDGTKQFAWFDTITDTFESMNDYEVWENWEDFEIDFKTDREKWPGLDSTRPLQRYKDLFPKNWNKGNNSSRI